MLEIIAQSLEDALTIERMGGNRIELIQSLGEGGLTPSVGLVKAVLSAVSIPVNVMIRPHSRHFRYSPEDLEIMREDVLTMEKLGVKHVVLGILDEDGLPDMGAMEKLLADTHLTVTFHRAIDESADLRASLERLKSLSAITHVLTSGGEGKAEDYLDVLKNLIRNSGDLRIIVASGIHAGNLSAIRNELEYALSGDDPNGGHFDLHVGTGVRSSNVNHPVHAEEVEHLVAVYRKECCT